MFGQQHGGTSSPVEGGRIVKCIKFGREMPGPRLLVRAEGMKSFHTGNLRSFGFNLFGAPKVRDANLKKPLAKRP
jgi:hypothetical protein